MSNAITVIVPFYNGNIYIKKLIHNVDSIVASTNAQITDLIIVNDSPWEKVVFSQSKAINISILDNESNIGIQASRVKGLNACKTPFVIFLDQDDELVADGFNDQVELIKEADIVVGNGVYQYGGDFRTIYKNKEIMNYLINKKRMIRIRNLIPSPGSCLIRKDHIPEVWKHKCLKNNGADDWLLWLLLFGYSSKFAINEKKVYQHNSTSRGNLSFNLPKMHDSSLEMWEILNNTDTYSTREMKLLKNAIEFKYLQDTKQLTLKGCIKYKKTIGYNIFYKIHMILGK